MERSKKIIFVSHALLNQNAMSVGKAKFPGVVKDIVELLAEAGVGIVQMPSPEFEFNGSPEWKFKPKESWDKTKGYRTHCRSLSLQVLKQIEKYMIRDYRIVGILGVEMDPTSAVYQVDTGTRAIPGKGIFIEELEEQMKKKNFQVPIIGVNLNNIYSSMEKLQSLLKYS